MQESSDWNPQQRLLEQRKLSSHLRLKNLCLHLQFFYSLYKAHFVNAVNSAFQSLLAHLAIVQDEGHNSHRRWAALCAVGPAGTLPPHWSAFSCRTHFIQKKRQAWVTKVGLSRKEGSDSNENPCPTTSIWSNVHKANTGMTSKQYTCPYQQGKSQDNISTSKKGLK